MTVGLVFRLAWLVGAVYCATHARRDLSEFDMRRCYALHQQLHCWPKHETCWFAEDRAICWQVATVKPR